MLRIKSMSDPLDLLLKRRGYHSEFVSVISDITTYHYKSKITGDEITISYHLQVYHNHPIHKVTYYIRAINGVDCTSPEDVNSKLASLAPYRVYPYSANSTNFSYMMALANRMKKLGVTIASPDVIDKLYTLKSYKEYIDKIKSSYPNETPIAYLAMLCKVVVGTAQRFKILHGFIFHHLAGITRVNSVPLPDLMKYYNLTWNNCWRYLRALAIFGNWPRVRKEDVVLSELARSLKVDYNKIKEYNEKSWSLSDHYKSKKSEKCDSPNDSPLGSDSEGIEPDPPLGQLDSSEFTNLVSSIKKSNTMSGLLDIAVGTGVEKIYKGAASNIGVMMKGVEFHIGSQKFFIQKLFLVILKKPGVSDSEFESRVNNLGIDKDHIIKLASRIDFKAHDIDPNNVTWLF